MVPIHVIGGGLAGSEAAWQIAQAGWPVVLHEMRPVRETDVHVGDGLAELVCSNSFRSDDAEHNAVGLLHEELRRCGSLIMSAGDAHRVPAGGAMAVDRVGFSRGILSMISIPREMSHTYPIVRPCRHLTRNQTYGFNPSCDVPYVPNC